MPAPSVTSTRSRPVASECTVTFAFGTTAPLGSVTTPVRVAVDCPHALIAKTPAKAAVQRDWISFIWSPNKGKRALSSVVAPKDRGLLVTVGLIIEYDRQRLPDNMGLFVIILSPKPPTLEMAMPDLPFSHP